VEVQYPGKGSGFTCRSTAHGANRNQTEPQNQPHSHPTRVLLRWIRGGDVWCRSTAFGANWAGTHSHPARVLLQQIREFAPVAGAPTTREGVGCYPHISCASSTASSHSWARCSSSSSSYSFILFSPS